MRAVFKNLAVPLLASEAVLLVAVAVMYLLAHRVPVWPEDKAYVRMAFMVGLVIVLVCWPVCRLVYRVPGTLVGLALGLATPAVVGWLWSSLAEYFEYYSFGAWARNWGIEPPWTFWVLTLTLSIPSAIAGAVVGFLQAKRPGSGPTGPPKCKARS